MVIEDFRTTRQQGQKRFSATVHWEDSDRPSMEIFFETAERFFDGVDLNPQAFLAGVMLPAMHHGEQRISMAAEICPELREGLLTVMHWLRHWYYQPSHRLVRLEVATRSRPALERPPSRAGVFFSGGIDSLAVLRANRLHMPLEHPASFRDALIIYGQNVESDPRPETFAQAVAEFSTLIRGCGMELVPVHTNLRQLDVSGKLFDITHGSIMGAVAQAFAGRLGTVSVASSDTVPELVYSGVPFMPYGSSPLIEPNFSSAELRVRFELLTVSRLEKVQLVAGWEEALDHIRVCGPQWPGPNCGLCEKCTRTMLELLALGLLEKSRSFPFADVTEEMLSRVTMHRSCVEDSKCYYLELTPIFASQGRHDLVRAIHDFLARSSRPPKRSALRVIDDRYLFGTMRRLKKYLVAGTN